MSKKFRKWAPDQTWLLPPSPRDWLNENHRFYFLLDVVGEMDLEPFFERYKNSITGQPPFHPRMMVTLLLYGYCKGVFSSRKIQSRCVEDVAFRVIVGEDIPDFSTISDFRKDSLEHMLKDEERLKQEIFELMAQADAADAADDEKFGDRHGDEIPDELARRESRLAKIWEAREALEAAARQKAAEHAAKMEAEGREHRTDPDKAVPSDKDQRNFTDLDSKIMKTSNKGFDQCGNAQIVATEDQIIVAADVTDQANYVRQVEPMVEQLQSNVEAAELSGDVKDFLADAGYFSEANTKAFTEAGMNPFIATQRLKHNEQIPESQTGWPTSCLVSVVTFGRPTLSRLMIGICFITRSSALERTRPRSPSPRRCSGRHPSQRRQGRSIWKLCHHGSNRRAGEVVFFSDGRRSCHGKQTWREADW